MYFPFKDTLEEILEQIALEWLQEATEPFPVFLLNQESFQMVETPDPRGGSLRVLIPLGPNGGICYYLYRP
jgi:hypothetical protein